MPRRSKMFWRRILRNQTRVCNKTRQGLMKTLNICIALCQIWITSTFREHRSLFWCIHNEAFLFLQFWVLILVFMIVPPCPWRGDETKEMRPNPKSVGKTVGVKFPAPSCRDNLQDISGHNSNFPKKPSAAFKHSKCRGRVSQYYNLKTMSTHSLLIDDCRLLFSFLLHKLRTRQNRSWLVWYAS